MTMKHPIQPLEDDALGVPRFKANRIVRDMLDFATPRGFSMNSIATADYSAEDRQQFAQLIGYSLGGYGELSYVDDVAYSTAANMADGKDERGAHIAALEEKLQELRGAINCLREPVARLLEMHPDDLQSEP